MKLVYEKSMGRCLVALMVPAIAMQASPASAQEVDEIVVSAQRREQNQQDVGISITAISGETLRSSGITSAEMLQQTVPGLRMVNTASGTANTLPSIRGVSQNDYATHQEMPNAVYIDGVYISNPAAIGFGLFDLERVEVLRGPQGTLFGRNATGGLVQFVTAKPSNSFEAYADLSLSDTNGFGWRTEAMLSGPLSNSVRARLSGFYEDYAGYWKNTAPGGKDALEIDGQWAVRGRIDFDATDKLTIGVSLNAGGMSPSRQGVYSTVPAYVDPNTRFGVEITPETDPGDIYGLGGDPNAVNGVCPGCDYFGQLPQRPYKGAFNSDNFFLTKDSYAGTINLEWDMDALTLTSVSNYQYFKFDYSEDCDGSPIDYCRSPFGTKQEQWSQELRLNGESGPLTWQAGAYYIEISQNNKVGFDGAEGFVYSILNKFTQDTKSWAVFGQAEYKFSDKLTLIGGLRWSDETKSIDSQAWNAPAEFFPNGSIVNNSEYLVYDYQGKRPSNDWSGKIELDYKPSEDVLLFASVNRGTKGGGYNGNGGGLDNASLDSEVYFRGEALVSYEAGFKATLWDGRARLNGSGFVYDYNDYQSFELRNSLAALVANKDATFYGGELELSIKLEQSWDINLGLSLLHTKVRDITLPNGDVVDRESAVAPAFSVTGSVRKQWSLSSGTVAANVDFNYVDDYFASTFNQAATAVPGYAVVNARLGYASENGHWNLDLFAKNLLNSTNQSYAFDFAAFGINLKMYQPPRTLGVQFRYRWF